MKPTTFSILCICQVIIISLFTGLVVHKVTGDFLSPLTTIVMGGMVTARLWRTRAQPF